MLHIKKRGGIREQWAFFLAEPARVCPINEANGPHVRLHPQLHSTSESQIKEVESQENPPRLLICGLSKKKNLRVRP